MTLDIVGPAEIADMYGVTHKTVQIWQSQKKIPPPDQMLKRGPVWERETITECEFLVNREVIDG